MNPYISIISPVYNAEKIIELLVNRITENVEKISSNFEIILIEDDGPDNSWDVIENISKNNKKVIGIKLSRNFGQHYAITAGLDHAKGDWIIVMDCDLQDKPEEIEKLYNKAIEGFDIVLARRHQRNDNFLKKPFQNYFMVF
jgi:glycosyltransferase involved in cell wall biosynthesis